ncbi:MAG: cytochrome C, partial [Acidimicrobiales bacterium]
GFKVPSLFNSTQTQVAEAIRVGPMPMPIFSTQQISDAQSSAIAHYVQTLRAKTGPGGFAISSFGPVAEGFVAIIFGFGILLIAVRMIGTRG